MKGCVDLPVLSYWISFDFLSFFTGPFSLTSERLEEGEDTFKAGCGASSYTECRSLRVPVSVYSEPLLAEPFQHAARAVVTKALGLPSLQQQLCAHQAKLYFSSTSGLKSSVPRLAHL